ncbi:MAG: peptidoglycan-binding domain-containing protein [Arenicellales bacterium]|nr:peptidoglycan-binding domain-containing protein [Arenicellales bacterium]
MAKPNTRATVLLAAFFVSWLWSVVFAQNLKDEQAESRLSELQRTDEFNIRAALRKALDADDPEVTFHWHNPHTQHNGAIVTLNPIGQGDNGKTCVDLVHVYYLGESSGGRHETTLCKDGSGNWNDTRIYTASAAPSHLQIYAEQTIYDVQNALTQLNYAPGSVDGVYGGRTRRAIEEFQRDKGLPVTGNINEELLAALKQSGVVFLGKPPVPKTEFVDAEGPPVSSQNTADSEPAVTTTLDKGPSLSGEESPVVIEAAATPAPKTAAPKTAASEIVGDVKSSVIKPSEPLSTAIGPSDSPASVTSPDIRDEANPTAKKELGTTMSSSTDPETKLVSLEPSSDRVESGLVDPTPETSILRDEALSISEQLNKLVDMAESFDSHWFFIAGFAMCCLAGAFAAWFFTPKINHIIVPGPRLEPDEEELKAKIALVTRRLGQTSAPPTDWSYGSATPHGPPHSGTQETDNIEHPANTLEQQRSGLTSSDETDAVPAPADKVAVNDARVEPRLEKIAEKIEKKVEQPATQKVPTPSQDATETIKQADEFIDIIEAIKEAEDLIKEAQQILKNEPLEGASKDHITNAIKQATELIKEALNSGPIEGGSSKEITKALKNASVLIKQSLTKDPIGSNSQLKVT